MHSQYQFVTVFIIVMNVSEKSLSAVTFVSHFYTSKKNYFINVKTKFMAVNINVIIERTNEQVASFINNPSYACATQVPADKPSIRFITFQISRLRSFRLIAFCCLFQRFVPFIGGSFLVKTGTGLYIL